MLLVVLVPAAAYHPFSTGAPPTIEMLRVACKDEVAACELDCTRDAAKSSGHDERAAIGEPVDPSAGTDQASEERPLTDNELDHLIELNRPAAQVKVALRKVSLTKSQIKQLLALEERTPGVYGNRRVVKNMLNEKTPSDKYQPKQYCCGEMLSAVLNGNRFLGAEYCKALLARSIKEHHMLATT